MVKLQPLSYPKVIKETIIRKKVLIPVYQITSMSLRTCIEEHFVC